MATAKAPSKVILGGEHSIVYPESYCLAAAIDNPFSKADAIRRSPRVGLELQSFYGTMKIPLQTVYETIEKFDELHDVPPEKRKENAKEFLEMGRDWTTPLTVSVGNTMREMGSGMRLRIEDSPRPGASLGSSTSVFAASIAAAQQEFYGLVDESRVRIGSNFGDHLVAGTPSGIDASIITEGGYALARKKQDGTLETQRPELPQMDIVVADTGIDSKTGEAVASVRKQVEEDEENKGREAAYQPFRNINSIVHQMTNSIKRGDIQDVGYLMNKNHEELRGLGVSHPSIEKLRNSALENGAYGGKVTGGGQGGSAIFVAEDPHALSENLNKKSHRTFVATLGAEGVRAIT